MWYLQIREDYDVTIKKNKVGLYVFVTKYKIICEVKKDTEECVGYADINFFKLREIVYICYICLITSVNECIRNSSQCLPLERNLAAGLSTGRLFIEYPILSS